MDYYDEISLGYDELYGEEQLKKLGLIRTTIAGSQELKIAGFEEPYRKLLDVGCGSGISTRYFDSLERTGIDPSKELIRIAIKNDPQGFYIIKPAEEIPFLKQEFDIVISLTAIQNFNDVEKGLRKLKNCGRMFILTFLKRSPKRELIENLIENHFKIIKKIEEEKDIIYFCKNQ